MTGDNIKSSPHGGDIYGNSVKHDFSVNINPKGTPKSVREAVLNSVDIISKYPDLENRSLKTALSNYFKLDMNLISVGNGASELIMAVFNALRPHRMIITAPDFSGYIRAARAIGCNTEFVNIINDSGELLSQDEIIERLIDRVEGMSVSENSLDVSKTREGHGAGIGDSGNCGRYDNIVMLTNPNNPVGHIIKKELMLKLLEICRRKKVLLGVDESFISFSEGQNKNSLCSDVREGSLLVFRSFTKLFAMPGLRLGALLAEEKLIRSVESFLPEWNISSAAAQAGIEALKEGEYIESTPEYTRREREYLEERLNGLGLKTFKSAVNYILTLSDLDLYKGLLERGILIRDCSNYEGLGRGFYRFAVKSRQENEELIAGLKSLIKE